MELSRMTAHRKFKSPEWQRNQPSRIKGAAYTIGVVIVIFGGMWLVQVLQSFFPGQATP
jgi:hypothetical protein